MTLSYINNLFWEYDSRIGRFFSTDPRQVEYPWQTPYAYFSNSPIWIIDFLGMGDNGDAKAKEPGRLPEVVVKTKALPLKERLAAQARYFARKNKSSSNSSNNNLTYINVPNLQKNQQQKCHEDYRLDRDAERLKIAQAYANLDHKHGQVDFPRSQIWDILGGKRSLNGLEVGANGYLTGNLTPITGTPPNVGFGSGTNLSGLSNLVKTESQFVTIYRNFSKDEMISLLANDMRFVDGISKGGKDFWLTENGLSWWKTMGWGGKYTTTIQVEKSFLSQLPKSRFASEAGHPFINLNDADLGKLKDFMKSIQITTH